MKYQGFLCNIRPWKYARISCALLPGLCCGPQVWSHVINQNLPLCSWIICCVCEWLGIISLPISVKYLVNRYLNDWPLQKYHRKQETHSGLLKHPHQPPITENGATKYGALIGSYGYLMPNHPIRAVQPVYIRVNPPDSIRSLCESPAVCSHDESWSTSDLARIQRIPREVNTYTRLRTHRGGWWSTTGDAEHPMAGFSSWA